jgi:hypothetical protein
MLESLLAGISAVSLSVYVSKTVAHLDCTIFGHYSFQNSSISVILVVDHCSTTIFKSCYSFNLNLLENLTRPLRNIHCLLGKQLQCRFGLVF